MRSVLFALVLALAIVLVGGAPTAHAQAVAPCAIGSDVPFDVPLVGVDPAGRAFAVQVAGWYGPYDGFGYPAAANTYGFYAGLPVNRWDFGYFPAPCPLVPAPAVATTASWSWEEVPSVASRPTASARLRGPRRCRPGGRRAGCG